MKLTARSLEKLHQFVLPRERAEDFSQYWMSLIEAVLFTADSPLTMLAVKHKVEREFSFAKLTQLDIGRHLSELKKSGHVQEESERYVLASGPRASIKARSEDSDRTRSQFDSFIWSKVSMYVPLTPQVKTALSKATNTFMAHFLSSRTVGGLAQIAEGRHDNAALYVPYIRFAAATIRDQTLADAYCVAMVEGLQMQAFSLYFWKMLQKYIAIWVMRLHPDISTFKELFVDDSVVYLDTNVVVGLLLPSEPHNDVCVAACEYMNALEIDARVTKETLDELLRLLRRADEIVTSGRPLSKDHDNPFVKNHLSGRRAVEGTWEQFYMRLSTRMTALLNQLGIVVEEKDHSALFEDPDFPDFFERVKEARLRLDPRGGPKPDPLARHDALHLLLVKRLREHGAAKQTKYWFLSYDLSLYLACSTLPPAGESPLCLMLDVWLQFLSLFPLRSREETEVFSSEVARFVMGYFAGSWADRMPELGKDDLRKLLKPRVEPGEFLPEQLLQRAETVVLRQWMENPQELLLRQHLAAEYTTKEDMLRLTLDGQGQTIARLDAERRKLKGEVAPLRVLATLGVVVGCSALSLTLLKTSSPRGSWRVWVVALLSLASLAGIAWIWGYRRLARILLKSLPKL